MNKTIKWLLIYTAAVLLLGYNTVVRPEGEAIAQVPATNAATNSTPLPALAQPPMPVLRGLESSATLQEKGESSPAQKSASVESYFMVGSNRDTGPTRGPQMQPRTVVYSTTNDGQPLGHKEHGFFWHLFDNLGVPMFGKTEAEIDPSIKTVYVIPPPKLPSERVLMKGFTEAAITENKAPVPGAAQNAQPAQQKIPESELEGTIYETPASKDMPAPAQ